MTIEYLVMRRSAQWWTTKDGSRFGPYASEKTAVNAAIQMAKLDARQGQSARVSVDEPEDGIPVVYDSWGDTDIR